MLERRLSEGEPQLHTLVRLGAAYWAAGRTDEAVPVLASARALDPEHPAPHFYLGVTHEDAGAYGEARVAYARYLELGASPRLRRAVADRLVLMNRRELEVAVREALAVEDAQAGSDPVPNSVGLFPFLVTSEDPALSPLGRAMAELLATDLARNDRVTVLERVRIQLLLDEMALAEAGRVDAAGAARAGRILGAENIVQGRMDAEGRGPAPALELEAYVVGVAQGTLPERPDVSDGDLLERLFELEARVALGLFSALGVQLTPAERAQVTGRTRVNLQALLAFGAGLEAGDGGDFAAAFQRFSEAVDAEPSFVEAGERAEEARAMAEASATSTRALAELDEVDLMTELGPEDWRRLQRDLRAMIQLIPDPGGRDALPEVTQTEGVGERPRGIIEFIFRRP